MKGISLPALLIAVLFGVMVWLSAVMRESYQVTVAVPLTIENVPEGYAIKSTLPHQVHLRLRGEGWTLATMLLGPSLSVRYPISSAAVVESQGRRVRESRVLTAAEVAERLTLRPGVLLMAVEPDSILIELDRFARKRVPIIPDLALTCREGYGQSGPATVVPESVTVSGAAAVLAHIDSWKTTRTVFDDVRSPVDAEVALAVSEQFEVTTSIDKVHLSVAVEPFAEKTLSGIAVETGGAPPDRELIFIPPKIEVVVRGGIARLSSLSDGDIRILVPYNRILADTTGIVEPGILFPQGLQLVSKRPERVQYIVRKRI
jgi:hypothetical protein